MFDPTPLLNPKTVSALMCLTLMAGLGASIWLHVRWSSEARLRRANRQLRERLARYESV